MRTFFAALFSLLSAMLLIRDANSGSWLFIPSVSSWSPQSEGECVYAYEYFRSASVTRDGSDNVSGVSNQCSGGVAIADATNGTNQPVYLPTGGPSGSTSAITFDGGILLPGGVSNTVLMTPGQALTQCFVYKFINFSGAKNVMVNYKNSAGSFPTLQYSNNHVPSQWEWTGMNTWAGSNFTQTEDSTTFHKICFLYNGGDETNTLNFFMWRDGIPSLSVGGGGGGGNNSVIGNYLNGTDNNWKSRAVCSAHYFWFKQLDATGLSNFSSYISANVGI